MAIYFNCSSQSTNHIENYSCEDEEMAESVKCVPPKPEDLTLTHAIPSWGSQRQENPWDLLASQLSLNGELQVNERPCLKETVHST